MEHIGELRSLIEERAKPKLLSLLSKLSAQEILYMITHESFVCLITSNNDEQYNDGSIPFSGALALTREQLKTMLLRCRGDVMRDAEYYGFAGVEKPEELFGLYGDHIGKPLAFFSENDGEPTPAWHVLVNFASSHLSNYHNGDIYAELHELIPSDNTFHITLFGDDGADYVVSGPTEMGG
jgi:hypothetical protein